MESQIQAEADVEVGVGGTTSAPVPASIKELHAVLMMFEDEIKRLENRLNGVLDHQPTPESPALPDAKSSATNILNDIIAQTDYTHSLKSKLASITDRLQI